MRIQMDWVEGAVAAKAWQSRSDAGGMAEDMEDEYAERGRWGDDWSEEGGLGQAGEQYETQPAYASGYAGRNGDEQGWTNEGAVERDHLNGADKKTPEGAERHSGGEGEGLG